MLPVKQSFTQYRQVKFDIYKPARAVFFTGPPQPEKGPDLAAKTAAKRNEAHEDFNSGDVPFNPDATTSLQAISARYNQAPAKQKYYFDKMIRSFENHLLPGVTRQQVWDFLKEKRCTIQAVIHDVLRFFGEPENGKSGRVEIGINRFLSLRTKTKSFLQETRDELEPGIHETVRTNLKSLLAEIQTNKIPGSVSASQTDTNPALALEKLTKMYGENLF